MKASVFPAIMFGVSAGCFLASAIYNIVSGGATYVIVLNLITAVIGLAASIIWLRKYLKTRDL